MEAIILAGGFGTRLAQILKDVPKPMAPVCGRPFLEYQLDWLADQGVDHVVLAVGYKKECIMNHFGAVYRNMTIAYSQEDTPLYTGGAARKAIERCREERVFIVNGDTYFPADLKKLRACAAERNAAAAVAVKRMFDFDRYGTVVFDEAYCINAFLEKRPCRDGYINGGIYDFATTALKDYPTAFSMENDCFPRLAAAGDLVACPDEADFIDIGIPEDYSRIQDLLRGKEP